MGTALNLTAERNKEWGASSYGWREWEKKNQMSYTVDISVAQ
jgi:hypothetical protein